MKKYLFILSFSLLPLMLHAQSLELRESLIMNEKLQDLVEDYKRLSSFDRRSDASAYMDLFVAPNAKVWCDYMSSEYFGRYVAVRNYVDLAKDFTYCTAKVSNLKQYEISLVNRDWHAIVEFDKIIDYEDGMGFTFSSRPEECHFAMDCIWLPKESAFRIEKIEKADGSDAVSGGLPSGIFRIVKRPDGLESKLLCDGKPLNYNQYGFAILPGGGEFTLNDDDLRLAQTVTPGSGRYDVYSFTATPKLFRVRPRMSFLINPITTKTVYGSDFQPASAGIEAAVDFGVAVRMLDNFKYVPYVGVGISHSWVDLSSHTLLEGHRVAYDYMGRSYKFKATETFSFDDFTLTLSPASFEYSFGEGFVGALETGIKFYFNMQATDIYRLTFTTPTDVNLIHGYRAKEESPLSTDKGLDPFWIASFFVKGGLDYTLKNGDRLFLHAGIENGMGSYTGTFKNVIYNNANPTPFVDDEAGIYPVVYRMNGSTLEDIKHHTFKSSIKSVRRRVSGILEFGYLFKF